MGYILKLFDTELLKFEVVENLADPVVHVQWLNEEKKELLPLGMEVSDSGLATWLRHRSIPKNRAYVYDLLSKCGLSANRPMDVIAVCKGLSLNDSYWVTEESYDGTFALNNLYENSFSQILAWMAFTGYGSSIRSSLASSPEFTTNGMLPKCWRRISGKVYLYKGATSGASNTGMEPYSEMYASMIGEQLGMDVVSYKLVKWKGRLCSVCELFTSQDVSYIPIGRIVKTGGMKAVYEYYRTLGDVFVQALDEMLVFDAIIANTDRHYGNFGVLVDSHTNRVIAPAPLFDHGNSLFNYAGEENFKSVDLLETYAATLLPCVYDDFFEAAQSVMNDHLRAKLRHLLNLELCLGGRYHYSAEKLRIMSSVLRKRIQRLLGDKGKSSKEM